MEAWHFKGLALVPILMAGAALSLAAKGGDRRRGAAFVLAWLVPGAGHALMGKWKKGLFFLAILGATCLFGLWIVGFRSVTFEDNPFYYVGQFGSGSTMLLHELLSAEKAVPRAGVEPSWFDPGLLYVCVVGLLNLVVTLNVMDIRVERPIAPPTAAPAAAGEEKSGWQA
jgi:hypothetical protein